MEGIGHTTKQVVPYLLLTLLTFIAPRHIFSQTDPNNPNILIILADDLGIDVSNGYQTNNLMPTTPRLDALRASGLTFKNAWTPPKCTPSRATIMSGHYGVKTGVTGTPGNLTTNFTSLYSAIATQTSNAYADAFIGKWHMSQPVDYGDPAAHGIDHFEGFFNSNVDDYYAWEKVTNGVVSNETDYLTSHLTDSAIDWVNDQNSPWFLWLAHGAPHSPFHEPPSNLHTLNPIGSNRRKYIAAIEAMDAEIGRLFDNIPAAVLANTLIIYLGDNGTPGGVIQYYPANHGKSSLYQGGVNVPLIVSGAGVTRTNEEETALVQATDVYATVLDAVSGTPPGGVYNSFSFHPMLSSTTFSSRTYSYTELDEDYTIRNDQYKLIEFSNCSQEFYDLTTDDLETNNLINSLTPAQEAIKEAMEDEATRIRGWWSCQDMILNGAETSVDDCNSTCNADNTLSFTNIGCCVTPAEPNIYQESVQGDTRAIYTNNFPNHNYCHTNANVPSPMYYNFSLDATPALAAEKRSILSECSRPDYYFGVAVNGVLMAPAPATPFIFENPNTGEYNWDWVFEPTNNQGSGADRVSLDCSSAHTGPQGYHYHGNMFEFVENLQTDISTTNVPPAQVLHVGWAADGYPVLYRFGPDGAGGITELQPSYALKSGDRPGDGISAPCDTYSGKYTNDYEYNAANGDLDECNGIARSVTITSDAGTSTFDYFYVVTSAFPQIPRCFSGTPDTSFDNANSGSTSPLPVDLTSFDVRYDEGSETVDVQWTTENEINVSHFTVERAHNDADFRPVATLAAAEGKDFYQVYDEDLSSGTYYYRLKVVDLDNSYVYTPIQQVRIDKDAVSLAAYPNPVYDEMTISANNLEGDFEIQLMDISGNVIFSRNQEALNGGTTLQESVQLRVYPAGLYFLKLQTATQELTQKILKID